MIINTERIKIFKNTPALFFFIFVVSFTNVYAAKLGRVEDLLGTSAPGASTNHLISFTTSSTIPVSGKIIITPEAGKFNLPSGLDFGDLDFINDGNNLPLAVSAGSGAGSAVGVTVATGTLGNITFTLNDTDAIAASSTLKIKIGTNATFDGGGNTQIQNPSLAGSYRINIKTKNSSLETLDQADTMVAIISSVNISANKAAPVAPQPAPPPAPAPPPSGGGGGGGGGVAPPPLEPSGAKANFSGATSPFALVTILRDGHIAANTFADARGIFEVRLSGLRSGFTTFGIFSQDRSRRFTITITIPAELSGDGEINFNNILFPPTTAISNASVRIPDQLIILGESFPGAELTVFIAPEEMIFKTTANLEGLWSYGLPTQRLTPGFHTLKVLGKSTDGRLSTFGELREFTLLPAGPLLCRDSDLNGDGAVNLTDISILLANWGFNFKNACADLNGDKKVSLIDFSIILHHWSRRPRR